MTYCNENDFDYLLLLDHDSEVTKDYLEFCVNTINTNDEVNCIVPTIINYNNDVIAPYGIKRGFIADYSTDNKNYSLNSGTLLNVNLLNDIGGFNELYYLDFLDHWIFNTLSKKNIKIITSTCTMKHSLSILSDDYISFHRYKIIVEAEINFFKKELLFMDRILYRFKLIRRSIKQFKMKEFKISSYSFFKSLSPLLWYL